MFVDGRQGSKKKEQGDEADSDIRLWIWWHIDTRAPRRTDPLSQNAIRNCNVRDRVENVASLVVLLSVHRCDEQNADGIICDR